MNQDLEMIISIQIKWNPHLTREDARRRARSFLHALSQTNWEWRRLSLNVLTALCREKDPDLNEEQAREQAMKVRRAIHASDKRISRNQAEFESHCILMGSPEEQPKLGLNP